MLQFFSRQFASNPEVIPVKKSFASDLCESRKKTINEYFWLGQLLILQELNLSQQQEQLEKMQNNTLQTHIDAFGGSIIVAYYS